MKSKIFAIILLPITIFLFSCESFLEEDPKGRLDESFLRSEGGIKSLTVSMYERAHYQVYTLLHLVAGGTDEITFAQERTAERMTRYQTDVLVDASEVSNAWTYLYEMLNNCNFGLSVVDEINFSTEADKNKVIGEFSFFRAWLLWTAVELWGEGAHFTTTPTEGVITDGYQTTIDVFYKTILDDIKVAGDKVPTKSTLNGEINKNVVKALKARVLMSLAQYSDAIIQSTGHNNSKQDVYRVAKTIADELITPSTGYKLLNDYPQVFDVRNKGNSEVIWALQMTLDPIYALPLHIMARDFTANPTFSLREKKSLLSGYGLYEHSGWYGRKMGTYMATYYYATLFDQDDKRLEGTFETVYRKLWNSTTGKYDDMGVPMKDGQPTDTVVYRPMRNVSAKEAAAYKARGIYIDGLNLIYTGANNAPGGGYRSNERMYCNTITKYLDRNRTAPKHEKSGNDIIIFRLAEQYLIGAECALFLEGNIAAKPYIDQLRERARFTSNSLSVNAADIDIDYILDERTREMGTEMIRWFDLKRTNRFERIKMYNPDCEFYDINIHKLRPIPNSELERMTNYPQNFKQNPGYPSKNN